MIPFLLGLSSGAGWPSDLEDFDYERAKPHGEVTLATWDLFDEGRDDHPITIFYKGASMRTPLFGDGDLQVTGTGFEQPVVYESHERVTSSTQLYGYLVRYRLPPPLGGWRPSHNGKANIWLQENEVAKADDGFLPKQEIGSFTICIGRNFDVPITRSGIGASTIDIMDDAFDGLPTPGMPSHRLYVYGIVEKDYFVRTVNSRPNDARDPVGLTHLRTLKLEGNTYYLDAEVVPKGSLPTAPNWHPKWGGIDGTPGYSKDAWLSFTPTPGTYEMELRLQGNVISSSHFVAKLPARVASKITTVTESGKNPVFYEVKYWHPDGLDVGSIDNRDLLATLHFSGSDLPEIPMKVESVAQQPDGWTLVTYRLDGPPSGWTEEENSWWFRPKIQPNALRTLTGESFPERAHPLRFIFIEINETRHNTLIDQSGPFTIIRESPFETGARWTRTLLKITYQSNEIINTHSIDGDDLARIDGEPAIVHEIRSRDDGKEVSVVYDIPALARFRWQAREHDVLPIILQPNAIATTDGERNPDAVVLRRVTHNGTVPNFQPLLSPSVYRHPGKSSIPFTVRYFSTADVPIKHRLPRIEVIAPNIALIPWEKVPPMPYRQLAKMVSGTYSVDGGKSFSVDYEIPAPGRGWTRRHNGPLEIRLADTLENGARDRLHASHLINHLYIDVPSYADAAHSLEIIHHDQSIQANASITLPNNADGVHAVTEWQGPVVEGPIYYLDALASPLPLPLPNLPPTSTYTHRFELADLMLPLTQSQQGPFEVVLRINGETVRSAPLLINAPASNPISPIEAMITTSNQGVFVSAQFNIDAADFAVIDWGRVIIDGDNLTVTDLEFRALPDAQAGSSTLSHSYLLEGFDMKRHHRAELRIDGKPVREYFSVGTLSDNLTPFQEWRRKVVERDELSTTPIGAEGPHPLGDLDRDGFSDFEEYAFNSNALLPESQPYAFLVRSPNGRFGLRLRRAFNRREITYLLEYSHDLVQWTIDHDLNESRPTFLDQLRNKPFFSERKSLPTSPCFFVFGPVSIEAIARPADTSQISCSAKLFLSFTSTIR